MSNREIVKNLKYLLFFLIIFITSLNSILNYNFFYVVLRFWTPWYAPFELFFFFAELLITFTWDIPSPEMAKLKLQPNPE